MTQLVNLLISTLAISAICVYILILRRMKSKHEQSSTSENKIEKRKSGRARATFNRVHDQKDLTQKSLSTEQCEGHQPKCSFYVGYLGTLAKGSTPPEECSSCPHGALCTIVPKKLGQPEKVGKGEKTLKGRVKIKDRSKHKKTITGQTKRGQTEKKPRRKAPAS